LEGHPLARLCVAHREQARRRGYGGSLENRMRFPLEVCFLDELGRLRAPKNRSLITAFLSEP